MVNHFSSLLLNQPDAGASLFTAPGFTVRALNNSFSGLYNILFSADTNPQQKDYLCQAYLEVVQGAGLAEAFTLSDDRITYNLNTDFDNFKTASVDFTTIYQSILQNPSLIAAVLAYPKTVDTDKYDNIWYFHTNPLYRLAGLIVAYVIRLS